MGIEENKRLVADYWVAFFSKDWKAVAKIFTEDAHYNDAGVDPVGAHGPAEIIARRSGLDATTTYGHSNVRMIAEADVVVTEHVELWGFGDGTVFEHPYVTVMEIGHGHIKRWFDYGDAGHIAANVPPGFFERASASERWPGEGF